MKDFLLGAMREIAEDGRVGAGNFLQAALDRYDSTLPLLMLDKALHVPGEGQLDALTLADLDRLARRYGSWYHARGVGPGDVVAIYLDSGPEFFIHYLALTRLGAIAAFVNGGLGAEVACRYLKHLGAVCVITDRAHRSRLAGLQGEGQRTVVEHSAMALEETALPEGYPFVHEAEDPVLITHTSGTTGFPKAVTARHRQYFHCTRETLRNPPGFLTEQTATGEVRLLSAFPTSHNVSVAYCMRSVCSATPLLMMADPSPVRLAQRIQSFKPSVVAGFARTFVDLIRIDLDEYDLRSVNYWRSTGDAMHRAHIDELIRYGSQYHEGKLVSGSSYFDGLGSSEICGAFYVVHSQRERPPARCVGSPAHFVDAVVLDKDGRKLGAYEPGLLGVRGPSIFNGYWNDEERYQQSLLAGYYLTGDVVFYDDEGRFYHADRALDVIETDGKPFYTTLAEEVVLDELRYVFECTFYGSAEGSGVKALVTLREPHSHSTQAVLSDINRTLGAKGLGRVDALELCPYESLVMGVTGKVLKREYRLLEAS